MSRPRALRRESTEALSWLGAHPWSTARALADARGIGPDGARMLLERLLERGFVVRRGEGRRSDPFVYAVPAGVHAELGLPVPEA